MVVLSINRVSQVGPIEEDTNTIEDKIFDIVFGATGEYLSDAHIEEIKESFIKFGWRPPTQLAGTEPRKPGDGK